MIDAIFFAPPGYWLSAGVATIFGLLVGSFLNVVIHRTPRKMQREFDDYLAHIATAEEIESARKLGSVIQAIELKLDAPLPHQDVYNLTVPRSACPKCGHKITALENIPIVSYLFLRGRCSECKTPISVRYPSIEFITALLSGLLIWHFGSGWLGLTTLVFAYFLLAMTFIDLDTQFLPDEMTLPLLWLGLLLNTQHVFVPLQEAVIGAAAGYLSLWSVAEVFKRLLGKEGMGHGDFKLLAALGAWLGWKMLPLIIILSSLVGAVVGIGLMVAKNKEWGSKIPFGPYLAGAGMLALLFGNQIVAFYLHTAMPN